MSEENLKELLARLATEPEFGARVRANPEALREGFGLTAAEAEELARMASQDAAEPVATATAEPAAHALATRESKSTLPPAALIAAGGGTAAAAAAAGGAYVLFSGGRAGLGTKYLLSLGGQTSGYLRAVDGGSATSDVVTTGAGAGAVKHNAGVRYEPISLEIGLQMDQGVYAWPATAWQSRSARQDGSVTQIDASGKAVAQLEFTQALLSEVEFPTFEAGSKNSGNLVFRLAPESTRVTSASTPPKIIVPAGKPWSAGSFELTVDGLDTTHVSRIESFKVTQSLPSTPPPEGGHQQPGGVDCTDLVVEVSTAYAQTWVEWFNDFLVAGNNGHNKEKAGGIRFLSLDGKTELGRVDLAGLGIHNLAPKPSSSANDTVSRTIASLYCTSAVLHIPGEKIATESASPSTAASPSTSAKPTPASPSPSATPTKAPRSPLVRSPIPSPAP